jgi:hypothetical protein
MTTTGKIIFALAFVMGTTAVLFADRGNQRKDRNDPNREQDRKITPAPAARETPAKQAAPTPATRVATAKPAAPAPATRVAPAKQTAPSPAPRVAPARQTAPAPTARVAPAKQPAPAPAAHVAPAKLQPPRPDAKAAPVAKRQPPPQRVEVSHMNKPHPPQRNVKMIHIAKPPPTRKVVEVVHAYHVMPYYQVVDREVFYATIVNQTGRTIELELEGSHEGDDDLGKLRPGEAMEYQLVVKTNRLPETFELEAGPYEAEFTLTCDSPHYFVLYVTPDGIYD